MTRKRAKFITLFLVLLLAFSLTGLIPVLSGAQATTFPPAIISGTIRYNGPVTGSHDLHVYALFYAGGPYSLYYETVVPFTGPGSYPYSLSVPVPDVQFPVIVAAVLDATDSGVQVPFNSSSAQPIALYPRVVPAFSGQETGGIDIDLTTPTGSISGSVSYDGSAQGDIHVVLVAGELIPIVQVVHISISAPGAFHIPYVPQGMFYVFAWRHSDGDGWPKRHEPQGAYGWPGLLYPKPIIVSAGKQVGGIDFSLYDPTTISGTVNYEGTNVEHPENYNIHFLAHRPFVDEAIFATIQGPGEFTLDMVPAGVYELNSWLDADGSGGWPFTTGDPIGYLGLSITVAGQPVTGVNLILDDETLGLVGGGIELQGRLDATGATVMATGTAGQFTGTVFPSGGYFLYLPVGSYDISVSSPGYLSATRVGVDVTPVTKPPEGMIILPPVTLLAGDLNNDGVIDIYDLALVASNFGKTESPWPGE